MLSGRDADDEEVAVVDPEVAQLAADLEWADRVEERLGAEVTNAGKKRRRVFVRHFRALTFRSRLRYLFAAWEKQEATYLHNWYYIVHHGWTVKTGANNSVVGRGR